MRNPIPDKKQKALKEGAPIDKKPTEGERITPKILGANSVPLAGLHCAEGPRQTPLTWWAAGSKLWTPGRWLLQHHPQRRSRNNPIPSLTLKCYHGRQSLNPRSKTWGKAATMSSAAATDPTQASNPGELCFLGPIETQGPARQ